MYGKNLWVGAGALALFACALTSCGGGGGGGGGIRFATSGKLELGLGVSSAAPADYVEATVTNSAGLPVNPEAVLLRAEIGQGVVAPITFEVLGVNRIRFITPLGVLVNAEFMAGPGTVVLTLAPADPESDFTESDGVELTLRAQSLPQSAPGDLALAYLQATRIMVEDSISNMEFIRDNTQSLDEGKISEIIELQQNQLFQFDEIIAAIAQAQQSEQRIVGRINDVDIVLDETSLASLDHYAFALFKIVPEPNPSRVNQLSGKSDQLGDKRFFSQSSEALFDIEKLNREIAEQARQIAARHGDIAIAVAGVATAGFLVMGSPALAVAAAGLGAVAWYTTTAAGAGIGMYLDAGTSAILNGEATTSDFVATGQFVLDRYLGLARGYVQNSALSGFFGQTWGSVIGAADDVRNAIGPFIEEDVTEAYRNRDIPSDGPREPVCGDGLCEGSEGNSCAQDCVVCGDGVCDAGEAAGCPADCQNVNQCCVETNNCPGETPDTCGETCCCCNVGQVCQANSTCG